MTDLQTALSADPYALPDYQGRATARTTLAITNAGDGLSESMAIDPEVLTQGSTVYVLIECRVGPHAFVPITDKGADLGMNELKQTLKAGTAMIVDGAFAKDHIAETAAKVAEARSVAQEAAKAAKGEEPMEAGMGLNGNGAVVLEEGDPEADDPEA